VAVWPSWTNTLYDFSSDYPIPDLYDAEYKGTPVTVNSIDNSFPNPLMSVDYLPVNPNTMKALPRPNDSKIDIGAIVGPSR
jgi:hypothetical protein